MGTTVQQSHFAEHADRFAAAGSVLVGGVSASLRVNHALGHPVYMERGDGPYLYDVDGRRYIDLSLANGAAILGHRHPAIEAALNEVIRRGLLVASESPEHRDLAETLTRIIPSAERARFSTTGVEATILAVRIAKAVTGRPKIAKFEGHFHGLSDQFMYNQSTPLPQDGSSVAESAGLCVPPEHTLVLPWNDRAAVERLLEREGDAIAAVICEPINFNSGCILPEPGFLEFLREVTTARGIVLIFDEVLSGFRMGLGGVQEHYGVTPDLTTLAKALAGGATFSATVGRADLMDSIVKKPVSHSGTYSGHLMGVLAAQATLRTLEEPGTYERLNETANWFYGALQDVLNNAGLTARVQGVGARFGIYIGIDPSTTIYTFKQAATHDPVVYNRFVTAALERGVYIHSYGRRNAPGHAGISIVHDRSVLEDALDRLEGAARAAREA
jgi:glutamate-1-semialdehyde 2,1-aminomutase